MNRLARWTMRLYPAAWRVRYGDELEAMLADSGADARVVADLFKGGIQMRFSTWSFGRLALVLGAIGMIVGFGSSFLVKPEYTSRATMRVTPAAIQEGQPRSTNESVEAVAQLKAAVLSDKSLADIAKAVDLYDAQSPARPLGDVIEEVKRNTVVQQVSLPGMNGKRATAFDIRFTYTDRFKAQQTVRTLINAFDEQNRNSNYVLDVLDTATLPTAPAKPDRYMFGWIGCIAGLFAATIVTVIRQLRHAPPASLLESTA